MMKKKIKNHLLIPYVTSGFPSKSLFIPILKALSESNADYIEIGVPHSDPLADGPLIQHSSKIALQNNVSLKWIVKTLKKESCYRLKPLILFSYLNPILSYGFEKLLKDLQKPLFYGLIIPDLPLDEAEKYLPLFKKYNLNLILLAAPNTNKTRLKKIAKLSSGFIYLVSVTGTTGVRKNIAAGLKKKIKELKSITKKPVCVGFGVSSPKQVRGIISYGADGVVLGSILVKKISSMRKTAITSGLKRFINFF